MKGTNQMPLAPPLYYFAAWTDSDCLCGCDHFHLTLASAVSCTMFAYAGAYVVAVERGQYRQLNDTEEAEFQRLMYGYPEGKREGAILPWPKPNLEPID
jgi:hypothetical protein